MRSFENCSPIVTAVYYLSVVLLLMLFQSPFLLLLGFLGGFSYTFLQSRRPSWKLHLGFFALFFLLSVLNPLFSHNGRTVLFFLNDMPITLEALLYGTVSAGGIVTVLYLFSSFTGIMTRDKLLYVFGALSPKLALVLSMGLRYVPLFRERAGKIADAQRALGLYKEDNIFDKMKSDLRVFSILITWALEHGITTADSMSARGYGTHRRTHFAPFRFRLGDGLLLALVLLCDGLCAVGGGMGAFAFSFYPALSAAPLSLIGVLAYSAFGLLSLLPILLETEERIKWRCFMSKI